MKLYIFTLFFLILLFISCKKEPSCHTESDILQVGNWQTTEHVDIFINDTLWKASSADFDMLFCSQGFGEQQRGTLTENFEWNKNGDQIFIKKDEHNTQVLSDTGTYQIFVAEPNYQEWQKVEFEGGFLHSSNDLIIFKYVRTWKLTRR
ncbi:MAG TPA: hypothetical protein PKA70_21450 [Saprospiraceae bacterium]|nr:hypothetical protein [Saprospiraceae bacterium]